MLRPGDLPVAFRLLFEPGETYESISAAVGVSVSSAHRSVKRLEAAGLMIADARRVNKHALFRFAAFGAPHVFFAKTGKEAVRGVPTAHSARDMDGALLGEGTVVWPSSDGESEGLPLEPLYDGARTIHDRDPRVYRALALLDAMRVSGASNKQAAATLLRSLIMEA